jgi:hypothetical protein
MKRIFLSLAIGISALSAIAQSRPLTPYEKANIEQYIGIGKEIGLSEESLRNLYRNGEYKKIETTVINKLKQQQPYKIVEIQDRLLSESAELEKLKIEKDYETDAYRTYDESDFNDMQQRIKKFYTQWKLKGEYEKTNEYENRMTNEFDVLNKCIVKVIGDSHRTKVKVIVLDYNPDTERMNFSFTNDKGATWAGYTKMPPADAKYIKEEGTYKLITSMDEASENDEPPLMFAYFNLVPSKLKAIKVNEKRYDLVITKYPYGLVDGSKLFTNENLGINSPVFKGYSLSEYFKFMQTNEAMQNDEDYNHDFDSYVSSLNAEIMNFGISTHWEYSENITSYKNYKKAVDSLYAIKPTHSGVLKSKELLRDLQSKALKAITDNGNRYVRQAKLNKERSIALIGSD